MLLFAALASPGAKAGGVMEIQGTLFSVTERFVIVSNEGWFYEIERSAIPSRQKAALQHLDARVAFNVPIGSFTVRTDPSFKRIFKRANPDKKVVQLD